MVVTTMGLIPAFKGDQRDEDDQAKKDSFEAGEPLKLSAGESYYGPGWWAAKEDDRGKYDRAFFDAESFAPDRPSWGWLEKYWTPLNSTGVAVNALSKHEHTTLVQGVHLSDIKCSPPLPGTLLQPPGIGSGGEGAVPVDMALNVEALRPVARNLTQDGRPGEPLRKGTALEQGDQREFVVRFFVEKKSCTFKAQLIVSSEGKKYLVRLPATWKRGGLPGSYTFRVTAPTPQKAYGTRYFTSGHTLMQTPPESITWDNIGRPTYVDPAQQGG
ncbi:hypothetical protein [Streptomyces sp. NPDC058989]|uniref:hypothetical protein n=1 Tax=Streptomyces sp. NPDC058989 TaxID=3346686 RepID=UPI0036B7B1C0